MSTTCFETAVKPRQLSFSWSDTNEANVATKTKARLRKAPARSKIERPTSRNVVVAPVRPAAEKTVDSNSASDRVGKPVHISGLMAAVLARYGIDPSEFAMLASE